jgi:DNA repair protein RadA/Sms
MSEVQALVAGSPAASPRRAVSGIESSRLAMLVAVLERRIGLDLRSSDVYASTVGGAALRGPAADLAIAIALTSAALDVIAPIDAVAIGEVGLAGELRRVPSLAQRLSEAARLGYTTAIVPSAAGNGGVVPLPSIPGLTVVEKPSLWSALRALRLVKAEHAPGAPARGMSVAAASPTIIHALH